MTCTLERLLCERSPRNSLKDTSSPKMTIATYFKKRTTQLSHITYIFLSSFLALMMHDSALARSSYPFRQWSQTTLEI